MTECERLIKEGKFTEDFFKEEVRCDFLVDQKRKKIWAVELDLLLKFDEICKKHNLKYFLGGGTLLGAIRHDGFIPWDDDIDVNMPRDDYEKFIKIASKELQQPYFMQTPYTDKGYYFSFAKMRNSNTASISHAFKYQSFNQGICIDIFPYDNMLPETAESVYNQIVPLIENNSLYMRRSNPNLTEEEVQRINNSLKLDPLETYKKIQALASQYNSEDTEYIGNAVCTVFNWKKSIYRKDLFQETIPHKFESITVQIPKGYLEYLEIHYGDWNKLPPIEKRGIWHNLVTIEPDIPYKDYLEAIS